MEREWIIALIIELIIEWITELIIERVKGVWWVKEAISICQ